jgi:arylsulfatase A-like enzyme
MRAVVITLWLLASTAGCGDDTVQPVEIPLRSPGTSSGNTLDDGADGTIHSLAPGHRFDAVVRLPDRAAVVSGIAPFDRGDTLSVSVASDDRDVSLGLAERRQGEWWASLEEFDGDVVRLQIENPTNRHVTLRHPRVTGLDRPTPPIFSSSMMPPHGPINVLLYVIDTLRADRLSVYGYARPTSPHLERLAARSQLFENAYAPAANTWPSIRTLFHSRFPSERNPATTSQWTLAEVLRDAGYATAAFQANGTVRGGQYTRGFDEYRHIPRPEPSTLGMPVNAGDLHAAALEWLQTRGAKPFFLYVQTMDVHFPYLPPRPFTELFLAPGSAYKPFDPDRYDGCVAYADHELAKLLDTLRALGLHERTAVIITADHGEPLGQRGEVLHGRSLYEELVRVPLVVVLPWYPEGRKIQAVVGLIDLAPTILDLAGVATPPGFRGHSFFRPHSAGAPPLVIGELYDAFKQQDLGSFVREGPWKLIRREDAVELFHLPSDPAELRDVSAAHPILVDHLYQIALRPREYRGAGRPPPLGHDLSAEERRQLQDTLEALGYVE